MSFSKTMGFIPKKQIQIDEIDSAMRNRIINMVEDAFDDEQAKYVLDAMGERTIREYDLSDPLQSDRKNLNKLIERLETLPWYNIYDILEYGYSFLTRHCKNCRDNCYVHYETCDGYELTECKNAINSYSANLNFILEQEKSGYRLIDGIISPIVGEVEIACIEEATNTRFFPVNAHLQKALQLYSDREHPDYENSIKESISAVEAMCCTITGTSGSQATLGNMLKRLEDSGLILHKALQSAFEKMYGFASDSDGIRHGGIDFKNAPAEDAKYMLISCSAFINYLIEKYSKIGGTT